MNLSYRYPVSVVEKQTLVFGARTPSLTRIGPELGPVDGTRTDLSYGQSTPSRNCPLAWKKLRRNAKSSACGSSSAFFRPPFCLAMVLPLVTPLVWLDVPFVRVVAPVLSALFSASTSLMLARSRPEPQTNRR